MHRIQPKYSQIHKYTGVFVPNCGSQGQYTQVTSSVFYQIHIYGGVCHKLWLRMQPHMYTDVQADRYTNVYVSNEYRRMTNCSASSQLLSKSRPSIHCVCTKTHKWIDANARRYQPGLTTRATSDNMHRFFQVSTYNKLRNEPMSNFLKIYISCGITWLEALVVIDQ